MAKSAGIAHVIEGTAIFWDDVDPADPYDHEETFACRVCGAGGNLTPFCGNECYQAWRYDPPVDPREEGW